ncbi:hypothetical protein IHE45_05G108800 [Dioscorea alata]|uniref:Uncharacterized protein n=1 Tax=Dioscorea alata TaxID=55571 RepID=A0ACB7W492_DIOAL|nr:hypothetical protein IHE45_05G108800 [Dioscorea alata]
MASSLKQLSIAITFIFFSISLLPIHARDSMFFSKMQRNETSHEVPAETPAVEKAEPMSFPPSSRHGHGLYGHGTNEFTNTINNNNHDDDAEKYDNYYSGHEASSRYVNNEYVNKGYGMSDTRFLENGKYYYDVQAEKYQNGYDPLSDQNSAGYVSYNGNGNRDGNNGYGSYRSGSSTDGNAYKEYNERVENQYNNERVENQYNNERVENQYNNERVENQYNNERFGSQYNSERFEDQYSNEGQEDQFNTP